MHGTVNHAANVVNAMTLRDFKCKLDDVDSIIFVLYFLVLYHYSLSLYKRIHNCLFKVAHTSGFTALSILVIFFANKCCVMLFYSASFASMLYVTIFTPSNLDPRSFRSPGGGEANKI
jgi:hypothetical protein